MYRIVSFAWCKQTLRLTEIAIKGLSSGENRDCLSFSLIFISYLAMSTDSELCTRLDDLVMRFFATLSELDGKKAELEALMSDGFMQLSKTRYDLGSGVGNRSIGAAMYDRANMKATVNVVQRRLPDHHADTFQLVNAADLCVDNTTTKSRENSQVDAESNTNCEGKEKASTIAASPDGLRLRKGKENLSQSMKEDVNDGKKDAASSSATHYSSFSPSTKADDSIENLGKAVSGLKVTSDGMIELETLSPKHRGGGGEDSAAAAAAAAAKNDPIRWFGILVPRSLKLSQKKFKSCLDLVVEIANLQLEVDRLQTSFKELAKKKKIAEETTEEGRGISRNEAPL